MRVTTITVGAVAALASAASGQVALDLEYGARNLDAFFDVETRSFTASATDGSDALGASFGFLLGKALPSGDEPFTEFFGTAATTSISMTVGSVDDSGSLNRARVDDGLITLVDADGDDTLVIEFTGEWVSFDDPVAGSPTTPAYFIADSLSATLFAGGGDFNAGLPLSLGLSPFVDPTQTIDGVPALAFIGEALTLDLVLDEVGFFDESFELLSALGADAVLAGGTPVPGPGSAFLAGCSGLLLLRRRRG